MCKVKGSFRDLINSDAQRESEVSLSVTVVVASSRVTDRNDRAGAWRGLFLGVFFF